MSTQINNENIRNNFPFLTDIIKIESNRKQLTKDRIFVDNGASTQLPLKVLEKFTNSLFQYANIHRGAYDASMISTEEFERAYNVAANFVNANSWREIIFGRNTTEMINLVMRGMEYQFQDGDNIVTTKLEHNSNYVPWFGLQQNLKKIGRNIEIKLVDFDHETGKLDMAQLESYVNNRTKLVTTTGASNFLGVKPDIKAIAEIAHASGYNQPNGINGSFHLVDGAQLVPGNYVDVQDIGCDFLAWSFHKMALPLGVGGLYGKQKALESLDNFLLGGDMILDVKPGEVEYQELPWRFTAGTPNILGITATGYGISHLINLALDNVTKNSIIGSEFNDSLAKEIYNEILINTPRGDFDIKFSVPTEHESIFGDYISKNPELLKALQNPEARLQKTNEMVKSAMDSIKVYEEGLTQCAISQLSAIPEVTIYGPKDATKRSPLVAFNIDGMTHTSVARKLNDMNVDVRDGTHCASLAHHDYDIPGTTRMSFYIYNSPEEVDKTIDAVRNIVKKYK